MHAANFFSVPKLLMLFHLSKVRNYNKSLNFTTIDVRLQLPNEKRVIALITISGTEKTFSDLWFVDNQSSIINLFC